MTTSPLTSSTNAPESLDTSLATTFRSSTLPSKSQNSPSGIQDSESMQHSPGVDDGTTSTGRTKGAGYERPTWHRAISSLMSEGSEKSGSDSSKHGVNVVQPRSSSNSQADFFSYPDSTTGQRDESDAQRAGVGRNGHIPAPRESTTAKERRLRAL